MQYVAVSGTHWGIPKLAIKPFTLTGLSLVNLMLGKGEGGVPRAPSIPGAQIKFFVCKTVHCVCNNNGNRRFFIFPMSM